MLKILLIAAVGFGAFSLFHHLKKRREQAKGPVYVCKDCNDNDCECYLEEPGVSDDDV